MNDTATAEPTTTAPADGFDRKPYDVNAAYNAEARPIIDQLVAVCERHGMPLFLTVGTRGNGDEDTEAIVTIKNHTRPGCVRFAVMRDVDRGNLDRAMAGLVCMAEA